MKRGQKEPAIVKLATTVLPVELLTKWNDFDMSIARVDAWREFDEYLRQWYARFYDIFVDIRNAPNDFER